MNGGTRLAQLVIVPKSSTKQDKRSIARGTVLGYSCARFAVPAWRTKTKRRDAAYRF